MGMADLLPNESPAENISEERQVAIRLMQSRGWSYQRRGNVHEFRKSDDDGWFDLICIGHKHLCLRAMVYRLTDFEPDLERRQQEARDAWLREKMPRASRPFLPPPPSDTPTP